MEDRITPFANGALVFGPVDILGPPVHEQIIDQALYFIKDDIRDEMADETAAVDVNSVVLGYLPFGVSDPAFHFDGSSFPQGAGAINAAYRDFLADFASEDAFEDDDLAEFFGILLHPVQDFYSHTNWVEYVQRGVISAGALAESGLGLWQPFAAYTEVQPNVLLVHGEELTPATPFGQVASLTRGAGFDVTVTFTDGRAMRGLISGDFDDPLFNEPNFTPDSVAVPHDDGEVDGQPQPGLNKDRPDRPGHGLAVQLATRQTFHEFRRLVNLVRDRYGEAGVDRLLCEWVDPGQRAVVNRMLGRPEQVTTDITVIDQSGSMAGGRLESAIQSAAATIGSRADFDRVGVVSFSSSASVLFPLTTIAPDSQVREDAQASFADLEADGSTSIGAGLRAALGLLDPDAENEDCLGPTSITVLTDGEENTAPLIADVEGEIPGYVTVHGIALGSGADAGAVQRLARSRGGQFFAAAEPGDLPAVYARVSGAVTGEQDVARRAGTVQQGGRMELPFTVDGTAGGLTVGVTWPGSDLDLTVIAPDGTVYTPANPGGGRFSVGPTAEFFRLPAAMAGTWRALVDGIQVDAGGEPFEAFARVASPLTADILTDNQVPAVGDRLPIRVRLTDGSPVLGATVRATVVPPTGSTAAPVAVTLFDDGTNGDAAAGDGIYTNVVTAGAAGEGVYTLQVEATGPGFVRSPSQLLLVDGFNQEPDVTGPADQQVPAGGATGPLDVFLSDDRTPAADLRLNAVSSDQTLVPLAGITITGAGPDRQVTVTPAAGRSGSAVITLVVTDAGGRTATDTFRVTVAAANTPPRITAPADVRTGTGGAVVRIPLQLADDQTAVPDLAVQVESDNPDLIPDGFVDISRVNGQQILNIQPTAGRTGTARFTLTVRDAGGLAASVGFSLTAATNPLLVGFPQFAAGAGGGPPTVSVFDPDATVRLTDQAFPDEVTGGVRVAVADINGDGIPDVLVGSGPGGPSRLVLFDGATNARLFDIAPFEPAFVGGVYVAAGDVTGDGRPDIVVTPDEGGGPRVDVYSGAGFGKLASFFGIDDPNFRGGARAAVGDVNGDGVGDVVVSAGFGGGPRIATFDGRSLATDQRRLFGDFFAFEPALRNGAFVAAGDLDADGKADLIFGGGPGGGPRVTAFRSADLLASNTQTVLANFFGGDTANRGGIRVGVKDLDGDDRADLVVGSGPGLAGRVTGYRGRTLAPAGLPPAAFDFDVPGANDGVFVG